LGGEWIGVGVRLGSSWLDWLSPNILHVPEVHGVNCEVCKFPPCTP
jgi:hypothetical protein